MLIDEIIITNTFGQIVYFADKSIFTKSLNLNFLSKGLYFLNILSNFDQLVYKIVKE